jgi:hypothetical protein
LFAKFFAFYLNKYILDIGRFCHEALLKIFGGDYNLKQKFFKASLDLRSPERFMVNLGRNGRGVARADRYAHTVTNLT